MMTDTAPKCILVLNMGGTINADCTKTEAFRDPQDGQKKTNVFAWRDAQGRLPVQIYLEESVMNERIAYVEISDLDSKFVTDVQKKEMRRRIKGAKKQGFDRVVVMIGTDLQTQTAQWIEEDGVELPVVFVGAMRELTRDLVDGKFIHGVKQKLESDGWQRIDRALGNRVPSEPGVYIEVNDEFVDALHVKKDFGRKRFVAMAEPAPAPSAIR